MSKPQLPPEMVPAETVGASTIGPAGLRPRSPKSASPSTVEVGAATGVNGAKGSVSGAEGAAQQASSEVPTDGAARSLSGVLDMFEGVGFTELWGGGFQEFADDDAEQIGDAYESAVVGGVLGVEDADDSITRTTSSSSKDLRDISQRKKKLSAKGLISNFVLSIIGTTTLGLSSQMKVGGWFIPPLMVTAGALIVAENTRLVCATIDKLQREKGMNIIAYPDFAMGAFGIWGKRVASVTSMCALIGMMLTSLVLESQNFNFMVPITWSWFGCSNCGRKWWALFLTPVTTLYVFGNPGALMKKTAVLGPLICLLTVIFAWTGGSMAMVDLNDMPESCQPQQVLLPAASANLFVQLAEVGSYGFYSFAVIVTVPTLRNQMKQEKKTAPAAIFAYFLSLFMFLPIMFLGYGGFGDLGPENLIDGMRHNRPEGWWATNSPWETGEITWAGSALDVVVTINILLTEAIYIPCTILAIEASFPNIFRDGPAWAGTVMRVFFIIFRFVVATSVDSFVAMSSLVSSLFCICNNILIPIAAFHWTKTQEVGILRKAVHVVIFVYGCFIMVLGTYSAIIALSPHEVDLPGSQLRSDSTARCQAAFRDLNYSVPL